MLLGFVVVVIGITLYQERKTERALEALRDLSSPRALVIRDGRQQRIAGREVVRGDLLVLVEGDRVPADAVLLDALQPLRRRVAAHRRVGAGPQARRRRSGPSLGPPGGDDSPFVFSGTLVVRGQRRRRGARHRRAHRDRARSARALAAVAAGARRRCSARSTARPVHRRWRRWACCCAAWWSSSTGSPAATGSTACSPASRWRWRSCPRSSRSCSPSSSRSAPGASRAQRAHAARAGRRDARRGDRAVRRQDRHADPEPHDREPQLCAPAALDAVGADGAGRCPRSSTSSSSTASWRASAIRSIRWRWRSTRSASE